MMPIYAINDLQTGAYGVSLGNGLVSEGKRRQEKKRLARFGFK